MFRSCKGSLAKGGGGIVLATSGEIPLSDSSEITATSPSDAPVRPWRNRLRTALKVSLGLVFSGVFIYLAARDADWNRLCEDAGEIQWRWVTAATALTLVMVALRLLRWGVALREFGRPSWRRVFGVGAFGAMAVFVLPVRLGEFVRPVFIARGGAVTFPQAAATIVVERLIDGIFAAGMLFLSVLFIDASAVPEDFILSGYFATALFGGLSIGVLVAGLLFPVLRAPIESIVGRISERVASKLVATLASFFEALRLLSRPRVGLTYVSMTLVIWVIAGLAMAVLFLAFPGGIADLPLVAAYATLSVLVVGITLPAGPAMAGVFHWGVVFGLTMFGVDPSAAFLYAAVLHLMHAGLNVTLGSAGWILGDIAPASHPSRPSVAVVEAES